MHCSGPGGGIAPPLGHMTGGGSEEQTVQLQDEEKCQLRKYFSVKTRAARNSPLPKTRPSFPAPTWPGPPAVAPGNQGPRDPRATPEWLKHKNSV